MYVADTHALLFYILKKAPDSVREIFKNAENNREIIYVPTIVMAEIFHAVLKGKIELEYEAVLNFIENNPGYRLIAFDASILKEFTGITGLELHDHIIVSTASFLGAVLITKDAEIIESNLVKTVW